ncbi:MAG TPA: hypothetical protein VKQ52_11335, partial [Puia sp.]|nr:hypothetical protein [Puia sp.]
MKKTIVFFVLLFLSAGSRLASQTLYVDAVNGNDHAKGTLSHPVASLEQAVALAKRSAHHEPVTIKIAPGLYKLKRQLKIEPRNGPEDTAEYTFEAMIMPDDTSWKPAKMPVIQSWSTNNTRTFFSHAVGFEILRDNVSIKGLKFVGNADPAVDYYYPIERDSNKLKNLDISQCYFIGDRNSAPIQGAVYTQG